MSLIPPSTAQQLADQVRLSGVLEVAEAAHHCAVTMREANRAFWAQPDYQLLLSLNGDVPATLATLQANTALGQAVNQALELVALAKYPHRAPVEMGRGDIAFQDGQFVIVPPVSVNVLPDDSNDAPAEG